MQVQVTESSTALKEANTMLSDTKRKCQALNIEKQAEFSMVRTFVPSDESQT